jgi:formylglycine-generating enzyme required for sulfatase activity
VKRFIFLVSAVTVLSMVLAACAPSATPAPTEAPAVTAPPATEPPATEAPQPTATDAPVVAPIDLAGPPMELGSRYTYIDGSVLVAVPAGKFTMGYGNADNPVHDVTLGDFWVYSTKVTNQQYANCVAAGVCTPPDPTNNPAFGNYLLINLPVTGVNYDQAAAYCSYVHGRLPSEAEWEKTSRGPDGNIFPWGNDAATCDLLNYNFCVGKVTDVTTYVKGVSYYGALDMSGNAREWVSDWYDPNYYSQSPTENPLGPDLGQKRSVRGSSYQDSADFALAAHRFSLKPVDTLPDLGFRCVVEDPTFYAPFCQTIPLYGADVNGGPTDDVIPLPDSCKPATIQSGEDCKSQATYVTVQDPLPAGWSANIPANCVGGPPTYKCTGSGAITLDAPTCTIPAPPSGGSCAPGFKYDGASNTCTGQGPGKQCMPGFNFDPAAQCCTAINPDQKVYGICPPGFFQQGNACLPAGSNSPQPASIIESFVDVPICGGQTHDGGDTPCDPAKDPNCGVPACDPLKDPSCGSPTCTNVTTCVYTSRTCQKAGCPQTCTTVCQ